MMFWLAKIPCGTSLGTICRAAIVGRSVGRSDRTLCGALASLLWFRLGAKNRAHFFTNIRNKGLMTMLGHFCVEAHEVSCLNDR